MGAEEKLFLITSSKEQKDYEMPIEYRDEI